ncbi:MAG: hypothetical protein QM655_04335 [Nocardioidaceae bacterium]
MIIASLGAVAFAAPAVAVGGNSGSFTNPLKNSDDTARLVNGTWKFDKWPGPTPNGFNYYGSLKDNEADGDWVYTQGKIDGYSWGSKVENHNGQAGSPVNVAQKVYGSDPPSQGRIQVCRERNLLPDVCSQSAWKYSAD